MNEQISQSRIAMRTGTNNPKWLLGDHLGSTNLVVNHDGLTPPVQPVDLYKAFGESRYTSGTLPTRYQFTGQFNQTEIGLYFYGARWYDSYLNRWIQPDSIIPDQNNPLDWDRYQYARSNPLRYRDPSGHVPDDGCEGDCKPTLEEIARDNYQEKRNYYQECLKSGGKGCPDYKEIAIFIGTSLLLASADILAPAVIAELKALLSTLVATACSDGGCINKVKTIMTVLNLLLIGGFRDLVRISLLIDTQILGIIQ